MKQAQGFPGVPVRAEGQQGAALLLPGDAQAVVDLFRRQLAGGCAGALIQKTQAVAHGAVGKPGKHPGSSIVQVDVFLVGHILKPCGNVLLADAPEGKPLAPGQDGGRNLVELRGGQNKEQVLRGFLNDL